MSKNDSQAKMIAREHVYDGYLGFYKYRLQIPSLNPHKTPFILDGQEVVHTADSVLVLIYAPTIDSFVFCKEFRPGVFFNNTDDDPFILQCVAGTIEASEQPGDTAFKEVKEETGITIDEIKLIASVYKSPGIITEKAFLYYAECSGSPQGGLHGVGVGDEEIETTIISRKKTFELMDEFNILDAATLLALNWFKVNFHEHVDSKW